MESALIFATRIAEQVGVILLDEFKRNDKITQTKPDFSLVTESDVRADTWLSREILQAFPHDTLLSEELHHVSPNASNGTVWVIDPLDGTTNFSLGLAYWGTSIARVENGVPTLAVIHFPVIGETYAARLGYGATFNGIELRVKPPDPKDKSTFFVCCSRTYRNYTVGIRFKTRILGSAAYSFCTIARSMALIAFEARSKIWDLAAAWLIVKEAGGYIATHNESSPFPIIPCTDYCQLDYPTLAAASPELMEKGKTQIQPKPVG